MHLIRGLKATGKESGQIAVLFAITLPLLLLFVGFAIDFGFGFLAKAKLAQGCDAATLKALLTLPYGQTQATANGNSMFALNTNTIAPLNGSAPTANFTFATDAYGDAICNCSSTATINTFFIRTVGIPTLTVSDSSQATRPPVILSLVLDRTGSMTGNGGAAALPPAVSDFLNYFIVGTDQLGEVSFAWSATNDVPITANFQTPINNSLSAMHFADGTYSMDGLQKGYNQITGVANPPVNAVKVMVFFTDGWDNTIQAYLPSPTAAKKVMVEFGGNAATTSGFDEPPGSPDDYLAFIDPNNVEQNWGDGFWGKNPADPNTLGTCESGGGWYEGTNYPSDASMQNCNGANQFTPIGGASDPLGTSPVSINRIYITQDAEYSTVQFANTMRAQGITVYSIGLGDDIDTTYLQEIANDTASPNYDPTQPTGIYEAAPTAADLDFAFQTIAAKILLRLTR